MRRVARESFAYKVTRRTLAQLGACCRCAQPAWAVNRALDPGHRRNLVVIVCQQCGGVRPPASAEEGRG